MSLAIAVIGCVLQVAVLVLVVRRGRREYDVREAEMLLRKHLEVHQRMVTGEQDPEDLVR